MFHYLSRRSSYGYTLRNIKSNTISRNTRYFSSDTCGTIKTDSIDINKNSTQTQRKRTSNKHKKRSNTDDTTPQIEVFNQSLEKQAFQFLLHEVKITPGTKILLSISGGVDSMAMLHLFAKVRHLFQPKLNLEVITFNHKLRPEAEEEIKFISKVAASYGIITHIREPMEPLPEDSGLQAAARNWRRQESMKTISLYENNSIVVNQDNVSTNNNEINSNSISDNNINIHNKRPHHARQSQLPKPTSIDSSSSSSSLSSASSSSSNPCIATAHHADDSVETMLLKFVRGVHLSHFTALSPRSDCGNFIKPLLFLNKNQIIEYMKLNQYEWREDESNQTRKYKRNEIRLDLIPLLEQLAGGESALKKRLSQLSAQSLDLQKWVGTEAYNYMENNVKYQTIPFEITTFTTNINKVSNANNHANNADSGCNDNNSISLVAILKDLTPKGKYFHLSNLIKMEIFDKVCQDITVQHMDLLNGNNNNNHSKRNNMDIATEDQNRLTTGNSGSNQSSLVKSDTTLIGLFGEKKECFLSHDKLNILCTLTNEIFPTAKGENKKSYQISGQLIFTRLGDTVKIIRDPISRQEYTRLQNTKVSNKLPTKNALTNAMNSTAVATTSNKNNEKTGLTNNIKTTTITTITDTITKATTIIPSTTESNKYITKETITKTTVKKVAQIQPSTATAATGNINVDSIKTYGVIDNISSINTITINGVHFTHPKQMIKVQAQVIESPQSNNKLNWLTDNNQIENLMLNSSSSDNHSGSASDNRNDSGENVVRNNILESSSSAGSRMNSENNGNHNDSMNIGADNVNYNNRIIKKYVAKSKKRNTTVSTGTDIESSAVDDDNNNNKNSSNNIEASISTNSTISAIGNNESIANNNNSDNGIKLNSISTSTNHDYNFMDNAKNDSDVKRKMITMNSFKLLKLLNEENASVKIALYNIPVNAELQFRHLRPQDVFIPPGRRTPSKVNIFLRSQHIPLELRDSVIAVELINGSNRTIISIPPYVNDYYIQYRDPPLHRSASQRQHFEVTISK